MFEPEAVLEALRQPVQTTSISLPQNRLAKSGAHLKVKAMQR
jgi:hypothetical protein